MTKSNQRVKLDLMGLFKASTKPREILAQKALDLANIGAGAILFGQFISERKFTNNQVVFAVAMATTLYILSFRLLKGVR